MFISEVDSSQCRSLDVVVIPLPGPCMYPANGSLRASAAVAFRDALSGTVIVKPHYKQSWRIVYRPCEAHSVSLYRTLDFASAAGLKFRMSVFLRLTARRKGFYQSTRTSSPPRLSRKE